VTSPIHDRLDFLQIDQKTKDDVKRLKPIVAAQMPVALARFYEHIKRYPETRKFFSSETMMKSATITIGASPPLVRPMPASALSPVGISAAMRWSSRI
jgi:hypothetical protein